VRNFVLIAFAALAFAAGDRGLVSAQESSPSDVTLSALPKTIRVDRSRPKILQVAGITKVEVLDPNIATPTILSEDRIAIQGRSPGETKINFYKGSEKISVPLIVESEKELQQTKDKERSSSGAGGEAGSTEVKSQGETTKTPESAAEDKPAPWVKLSIEPAADHPGQVLLTIRYGNRGRAKATGVVIRDALPPELEYVEGSASSGGTYNAAEREVTWHIDNLPPDPPDLGIGEKQPPALSFRVKPVAGPDTPAKIMNVATIEVAELEALFASNTVVWETSTSALTAVFAVPESFVVKKTIMMPMLDVRGEEYQNAVDRLEGLGVINGYPDRMFRPDAFVKRGEAVKMVVLGADLKDNKDATRITLVLSRAAKVTAVIKGADGKTVKTLIKSQQKPAGDHTIVWDGRADSGEYVQPGTYTYAVEAVDAKGMKSYLSGTLALLAVDHPVIGGVPTFVDVRPNDWYAGYVAEAENRHYVKGYPDGTFRASRNLSRAEATAIIVRALGQEEQAQRLTGKDVGFVDAHQIPRWATGYVAVATMSAPKAGDQLIVGYPGNSFLPQNPIRRTEAAAIVCRFVDRNMKRQQIVSGALIPGATLTINGKVIRGDAQGQFRVPIELEPNQLTTIAVLAP